jgi:hypothetical protein
MKICGPFFDGLGAVFAQASLSSKDVVQAAGLKGSEIILRSDFADDQGAVRFPEAGKGVIPTIKKADLGYGGWDEWTKRGKDIGARSVVGINGEGASAEFFHKRG